MGKFMCRPAMTTWMERHRIKTLGELEFIAFLISRFSKGSPPSSSSKSMDQFSVWDLKETEVHAYGWLSAQEPRQH
jgi:hypothetical protein